MPWLSIAVIVYGVIVAAGGVMGYRAVEGQSYSSLIAGGLSGLLLIVAGIVSKGSPKVGFAMATVLTIALIGFFTYRFISTGKMMPAMGVIGLSVVMLVLLIAGHFMKGSTPPAP